jgi:hypothetical protein
VAATEASFVFRARAKAGEPEKPSDSGGLSGGNDVQAERLHVDDVWNHEGNRGDPLHCPRQSFRVSHIDSDTRHAAYHQPASTPGQHGDTGPGKSWNHMVSDKSWSSKKQH